MSLRSIEKTTTLVFTAVNNKHSHVTGSKLAISSSLELLNISIKRGYEHDRMYIVHCIELDEFKHKTIKNA